MSSLSDQAGSQSRNHLSKKLPSSSGRSEARCSSVSKHRESLASRDFELFLSPRQQASTAHTTSANHPAFGPQIAARPPSLLLTKGRQSKELADDASKSVEQLAVADEAASDGTRGHWMPSARIQNINKDQIKKCQSRCLIICLPGPLSTDHGRSKRYKKASSRFTDSYARRNGARVAELKILHKSTCSKCPVSRLP